MVIHSYCTPGGKDLIKEYLNGLPNSEKAEGYIILEELESKGVQYLDNLNTRHLGGKLWEIKFRRHNRIFYVLADYNNLYLLHACKKQKGKAEKFELDKARDRAKEII
ncbi:MAG TPA: type II toxin-antitoxin system RelE/ParE family toxin [Clostridiales bacterium]|nr:type II toxin-antitoxin system RelE/ParE family toxin [Clostridiales bacterium]